MSASTHVPGGSPVITARGLTRSFGSVVAVDDLTLDVAPGVVGLVGSNGAGKSTLLKVLLGLVLPTSGSATVLGLDTATDGLRIRERVGYMPEHDCLPPDVTATEFVVHLARTSGLPRTAARERTADVLRYVGLFEERYRPMGGYSTGMKQRVKLAQALVHDPQLVLLDEPNNGLDPAGRDDMLALIRRIGSDGISVLVTSHLLGELARVCDAVVVLDGGRLLRATSTADATAEDAVLTVEVSGEAGALAALLQEAGFDARTRGAAVDVALSADRRGDADAVYDAVRDGAAVLGVGLLRLERRRHRLTELFAGAGGRPGG